MTLTLGKVLLIVACVLFVVASLAAGGVLTGLEPWAFGFGGFASWVLALALLCSPMTPISYTRFNTLSGNFDITKG